MDEEGYIGTMRREMVEDKEIEEAGDGEEEGRPGREEGR